MTMCLRNKALFREFSSPNGLRVRSHDAVNPRGRRSNLLVYAATPLSAYLLELIGEGLKLLVREHLDIDHAVIRRLDSPDDFIELELDRFCIPILRILNKKHYEKRHHGGSGIHDQLPGVGVMEVRPRDSP